MVGCTPGSHGQVGRRARVGRDPKDLSLVGNGQAAVGRGHTQEAAAQSSRAGVSASTVRTRADGEPRWKVRNPALAALVVRGNAGRLWVHPRPVPLFWRLSGRGTTGP